MHTPRKRPHLLGREMRLHQPARTRVILAFRLVTADRATEERRITRSGGGVGLRMRSADTLVIEQPANRCITGDQPGGIADRGSDSMHGPGALQFTLLGGRHKQTLARKRQLRWLHSIHRSPKGEK